MGEFVKKTMMGYREVPGGHSDPECTHVILTEAEYAKLLRQLSDAEQKARITKSEADKEIREANREADRKAQEAALKANQAIEEWWALSARSASRTLIYCESQKNGLMQIEG